MNDSFLDFFNDPSDTSDIAMSVPNQEFDLYFVPAFFGLQAPVNDPTAGAGFIGITPKTGKNEMIKIDFCSSVKYSKQ